MGNVDMSMVCYTYNCSLIRKIRHGKTTVSSIYYGLKLISNDKSQTGQEYMRILWF